jgi:hypothetical protein
MLYRVQHPARYASRLQTILSLDVELIDTHFCRPSTAATDGPRENPRRSTDTSANRLIRRRLQGSIGQRQRERHRTKYVWKATLLRAVRLTRPL